MRCSEISTQRTKRSIVPSRLNPQAVGLWGIKVKLAIAERGDFSVYDQAFEKIKSLPLSSEERLKMVGEQANLLLFERKYQQILQLAASSPDDSFAAVPGSLAEKYFAIGIAQKGLGDDAAARTAFVKAKEIFQEQLKQKPEDAVSARSVGESARVAW